MTPLRYSRIPSRIFSINELKCLSTSPKEQVILVFADESNKIITLCGASCGKTGLQSPL